MSDVVWFLKKGTFRGIEWNDLNYPCEETVNFEPNGSLKSRFVYGYRKKDNKFMKLGIVRNLFFVPFLVSLTFVGELWIWLNANSVMVEMFCLYSMLFLLFFHYFLRCGNVSSNKRTDLS